MKKTIIIVFTSLIALFSAYIIFNQFDIEVEKTEFSGITAEEYFGKPDFSKKNGFYRLLTLNEPEDVDVESDEVYMRYRKLYDPKYDNKKYIQESKNWKRGNFLEDLKKTNFFNFRIDFYSGMKNNLEWENTLLKNSNELKKTKNNLKIFLQRYQNLIESNIINNIINLNIYYNNNKVIYNLVPKLMQWMKISELYIHLNVLDSIEGNWDKGIKNLISHLNFLRKFSKADILTITSLISKGNMEETIVALNTLMNKRDCPRNLTSLVSELPDIIYEEYGYRNSIITEFIFHGQYALIKKI